MRVKMNRKTQNSFILKIILSFLILIPKSSLLKSIDQKPINYLNEDFCNNLSLITTTTFYEFTQNNEELNNDKWAWLGLITLRSRKTLKLKQISLRWNGESLDIKNLSASLYQKKHSEKILIPIEENFICDGHWDTKKQEISFEMDEKIVAVNKYYLVINFPEQFNAKIKSGSFVPIKMITQ